MVTENTAQFGTAFCVPIDAKDTTTTGISAADRAATVLAAIDPKTRPADLARPGHMFPLRARDGGVLVRAGQTEAAVDLARIAGLYPAGVICEIMNEDGTMARVPRADASSPAARAPDDHHRGPDPVPHAHRGAGARASRARRCRPITASSASSRSRASSTTRRTSRWSRATSATARTCWSACTRAA